jgi:hypothetical protein
MAYLLTGNGGPVPPAGYLPIEEHGIVGDRRTVALAGTDGTVDRYCPSRFDRVGVRPASQTRCAMVK